MNLHIHWSAQTTSTNQLAASSSAAPWTVWVTDHQTQGRGRLAQGERRVWHDPPGKSLLMSVTAEPRLPLHAAPRLTLAAGVAVAEILAEVTGVHAQLKWPNDIVVGDRKLGGILVESATVGGQLRATVGIGINVNVRPGELPATLESTATSLLIETGHSHDRLQLIPRIVAALRDAFGILEDHGGELGPLHSRWNTLSAIEGRAILVDGATATAISLASGGGLLIRRPDGSQDTVENGVVTWKPL